MDLSTGRRNGREGEMVFADVVALRLEDLEAEVVLLTMPKGMEEGQNGEETKVQRFFIKTSIRFFVHVPAPFQIVKLIDLYPVLAEDENDKESSSEVLQAESAARVLDHLRFFYRLLWRPWDGHDADDAGDFAADRLGPRMQMLREALDGGKVGGMALWLRVRALAEQVVGVRDELEVLEASMGEARDEEDAARCAELGRLESELVTRAEWLEDPVLRSALEARQRAERRRGRDEGQIRCNYVAPKGTLEETKMFFEKVSNHWAY